MGLLRKKRRKKEMLDLSLNITSLMDVLTVLLFFLLKSFSVASNTLTAPPGVRLPASEVKGKIEETVVVAMTSQGVLANSELVVKVDKGGRFLASDLGADQRTLMPLKKFLDVQFAKRNKIFGTEVDLTQLPPGRILFQADKELPFATLKHLLHTAAASGYSDYQFVVDNPEE